MVGRVLGGQRVSGEGMARQGFFPALPTDLSFLGASGLGKVQSSAGSRDTHSRLATLIPAGGDRAPLGIVDCAPQLGPQGPSFSAAYSPEPHRS